MLRFITRQIIRRPGTSCIIGVAFGVLIGFCFSMMITGQMVFDIIDVFLDAIRWLGPSLTSAWFLFSIIFITLLTAVLVPSFSSGIRRAFGKMTMKIGEISIQMDDGPTRDSVIELYRNAREQLTDQYNLNVGKSQIDLKYHSFMNDADRVLQNEYAVSLFNAKFRHCLYVPSYTDGDLVQATEYGGNIIDLKKRRGRVFSMRYGIIGKAFRTNRVCVNPEIGHDAFELAEDWGLTRAEAFDQSHSDDAHSLIAIPILETDKPISDENFRRLPEMDALGVVFIHVLDASLKEALRNEFPEDGITEKGRDLANKLLELSPYKELQDELLQFRKLMRFDQKAFGHEGA